MSEVKGHAAFHKHKKGPRHPGTKTGTRAERRALLKESMRHLDPQEVVRQAKKNSNIVTSDTHLNVAYVNDGNGGFEVATGIDQVLDYGDAREEKTRYLREGSRTVDLFVVHLPKTMCIEIKDFYPRYNTDGSERLDPETGEPMSRSRWVARDPDEAMRYYRDAVDFLGEKVIPGGMDAIHGWVTNDDESTPHIQIMGDPFAPDPKAPGMLRSEASRAYSSHRDVVCPEGTISIHRNKTTRFYRRLGDPMGFAFTPEERAQLEQLTGKPYDQLDLADLKALEGQKLSGGIVRYAEGKPAWGEYKMQAAQGAMRERMIAKGYPVEYEPGEHHGRELPKEVYEEVQDEKAEAASLREAAARGEIRNARDRQEIDRDSEIVTSNREALMAEREEVGAEREKVDGDIELVSHVKKSNAAKAAQNAADAAQNAADRAALDEARIDDAEALSWHRSDAGVDILAARVAAEEDLAELHYATRRRERFAAARIAAAAAFEENLRETGYRELDKIEDAVKRQQLTNEFEGAMAKIEPLPPVENRHAAAARRDRAQKGAARAALLDSDAPQQTRDRNVHDGLG